MKKPRKSNATISELITAECASVGYVYISCTWWSGRLEYNYRFVGPGRWGGMGNEQNFGCKSVDDNWDGLNVYSVVKVGSGSESGIITDDSETF